MTKITGFETYDVRFPTSLTLAGSDAMNPAPDYSAAYVVIRTDAGGLEGHGFAFTIGRGNDVQLAGIRLLEPFLAGQDLDEVLGDVDAPVRLGELYRRLVSDSPLHWLGPDCGVVYMAIGAVLNACWDLAARRAGKPLWLLLAQMTPEQLVSLVDFRYLTDALTPEEAVGLLERSVPGRAERIDELRRNGYPAYSTAPGWLGYSDEQLAELCAAAVAEGFTQVKLKVGAQLDDDKRRCALARETIGDSVGMAIDANQVWDVPAAIEWIRELAPFRPAWIEEPTAPEDVLGTAAIRAAVHPVRVATGEHVANRVMFKQLLQACSIDIMQIDACRVAGVNENIANLLLAARFGVPVCPHAGGVGLCEIVQHLSMFDYVALSGTAEGRRIEWVDHLHEHFTAPAVVRGSAWRLDRDAAGVAGRVLVSGGPGVARLAGGPLAASPLVFGGASIGGLYQPVSEQTAQATLQAAWDAGIRAFDTAPHYGVGLSEQRIGGFLAGRPRSEFAVSTKVGRLLVPAIGPVDGVEGFYGTPAMTRVRDYSRDGVLRSVTQSLDRMGLDRIDIALIHDPEDYLDQALDGAYPALAELRAQGVVTAIGAGMNYTGPLAWLIERADLDCVLVASRYTLLEDSASQALFPLCQRRGVTVLAAGVFNSGILAGGDRYDYAPAPPDIQARVRHLRGICDKYHVPLPAAALRYVLRNPAVTAAVVGARRPEEIRADAAYLALDIPGELWPELAR
jgi:L-fuconate dehydratase